jgi:hypothetical protein
MKWSSGKITIREAINTDHNGGTYQTLYPAVGDSVKLNISGDKYKLSNINGFAKIKTGSTVPLQRSPLGHLESEWLQIDAETEVSFQMTRFDVTNTSVDPHPVLFSFIWRVNGNIVSYGLEGGG